MSTNKFKLSFLLILTSVLLHSCIKRDLSGGTTNTGNTTTTANADVQQLINANIPAAFNYATSVSTQVDVTILAPDNTPVANLPVRILTRSSEDGGVELFKALTDHSGRMTGTVKLPADYTEVVVDPLYLGVMRNVTVKIVNAKIVCRIGGTNGYSGNVVPLTGITGKAFTGKIEMNQKIEGTVYSYMGAYNNQGKPSYLEPVNETISASFLADINASLPESRPVMTYHPDYLSSNAETNLNVTELSDVWFTFVTEGAGYMNSIGYYTYPTGNPPASAAAIDTVKVILPNASLSGSGGQLSPGNKVYLGRFPAGVSVGFVLIANGWNGTAVGNGSHKVYSNDALNQGATVSNKRQTVLLHDNQLGLFLVGFEDIIRDYSNCDHDFNDCVFYIKSNPVTAIATTNVNPMDHPIDADHDGVNDTYDDFPNDPTRAYVTYYPSATGMGTHSFEDNWPYLGDYDMNDLVVNYRYQLISNALNQPLEMNAKYVLRASGASFKNGFGVEFPFASSLVRSVAGSLVTNNNVVTIGTNGCESGQTKAVIIPFDDAYKAMNASGNFINTYPGLPVLTRDTISMDIKFTRALTLQEFGSAPFNPFIIIDHIRGREAHMAGYTPTSKMDTRYFGMGADNSIPSQGRYYKTAAQLPWGIDFSENFDYPAEGKSINAVFLKFQSWAQTAGTSEKGWYKDAVNTVTAKLFRR